MLASQSRSTTTRFKTVTANSPEDIFAPCGKLHLPIGLPDSLDSLKTFVEAEGNFSPGIGSFGVYFWLHDGSRLHAPTDESIKVKESLMDGRLPIPSSIWEIEDTQVHTEVCQIEQSHTVEIPLVGSRVYITNTGKKTKQLTLYVVLRPLGAAGYNVNELAVVANKSALLKGGHPALIAEQPAHAAGVIDTDTIGELARNGLVPEDIEAQSETGDCSGALRYDLEIPAGVQITLRFLCPVHAGQRAVRHDWVEAKKNYIDAAKPQSNTDGIDIPDLGLDYYNSLSVDKLFEETKIYWEDFYGRFQMTLPDAHWENGFYAMLAHVGLCMNEGAADVAVLNYTVFNRDGMYIANMMQKAGLPAFSKAVIDYFLKQPFNGRPYPESDNPGQILWSIGQHWRFTGDHAWLKTVYPQAQQLAEMIRYYRTTEAPFYVALDSLEFGDALPKDRRVELEPGKCDGWHPEYTEAFDLAGIRIFAQLAEEFGNSELAQSYNELAKRFATDYLEKYGDDLGKGYGSYSVLWPCALMPYTHGLAYECFKDVGQQPLHNWRYFATATAHQGLLAGNREAAYATIDLHLDHPQMSNWFAFDEGGFSGSGGWQHLRTTWQHSKEEPDQNHAVAMPHGWSIAEVWLLMRDALVYEHEQQLVLFAGINPAWLTDPKGIQIKNLTTYFGTLDLRWECHNHGATLSLAGKAAPPNGFTLQLPYSFALKPAGYTANAVGAIALPTGTTTVEFR